MTQAEEYYTQELYPKFRNALLCINEDEIYRIGEIALGIDLMRYNAMLTLTQAYSNAVVNYVYNGDYNSYPKFRKIVYKFTDMYKVHVTCENISDLPYYFIHYDDHHYSKICYIRCDYIFYI